jgi:hypothetical protein
MIRALVEGVVREICQGEGRGFESRRPLQRKSRQRRCERPKLASRDASGTVAHHISTCGAGNLVRTSHQDFRWA